MLSEKPDNHFLCALEGVGCMSNLYESRIIYAILLSLLLTDVILTALGYFFPDLWFSVFHGTSYNDPEGFLRRCAGNWLMFGVLQAIALWRWKRAPVWLAIVAGARFSDMLTDWNYLYFSAHITTMGAIGLFLAGPLNFLAGLYLFKAYKFRQGMLGDAADAAALTDMAQARTFAANAQEK
jgi:hypothetical protein